MFGKERGRLTVVLAWLAFQSPCAGNMFGKELPNLRARWLERQGGFNPRVRGTCLVSAAKCTRGVCLDVAFQSPCAGNMFGKDALALARGGRFQGPVSIPVCGEHVW